MMWVLALWLTTSCIGMGSVFAVQWYHRPLCEMEKAESTFESLIGPQPKAKSTGANPAALSTQ